METKQVFGLIDGLYTAAEANEVLLNLINSKLNFNNMAAFSYAERSGADVSHYRKRAEELKAVREALKPIIEEAAAKGYKLQVKGSFEISFVPQEEQANLPATGNRRKSEKEVLDNHYLA